MQQNKNHFDLGQLIHHKLHNSNAISEDLLFTFEKLGLEDFSFSSVLALHISHNFWITILIQWRWKVIQIAHYSGLSKFILTEEKKTEKKNPGSHVCPK